MSAAATVLHPRRPRRLTAAQRAALAAAAAHGGRMVNAPARVSVEPADVPRVRWNVGLALEAAGLAAMLRGDVRTRVWEWALTERGFAAAAAAPVREPAEGR